MARRPPLSYRLREAAAGVGRRLSALGAALVWPVEALFSFVGRKFFALTEWLNEVDSLLVAVVAVVVWPFRMAGRLVAAIGRLLLPAGVRRALAAPFAKTAEAAQRGAGGAWGLLERLNLDGVVLWTAWLTKPVWRPIVGLLGFAYAWFATRNYRGLLWGIPAVVLLLPIVAGGAWGWWFGRAAAADRYKVAVREAREKKQYDRMRLFERKLAQLGVDTRRTDFQTAMALSEEGKLEEAYERMKLLAPEEAPSFPAAHVWILQHMLADDLGVSDEERLRLADVHLQHLKKLGVRGPDFDFLRAVWLAQSQRLEEAAEALAPLISRRPEAAIERMRIDVTLGRTEEARRDARAVRQHMLDLKRDNKSLDAQQYRAWAAAEEILGDAERLAPVVRQWNTAAPDDPDAKRGLAMLGAREFSELINRPNADPKELAARLLELVGGVDRTDYQPQLVEMYRERRRVPALAGMFEELSESPQTPLEVLEIIGTSAALEGEIVRARAMLKRVVDKQPDNPVAWNNYAWTLTQEPDKNLDLALAASNHALAIAPEEFRFRETRGQINLALGRWKEAAEDLEFALNGMPTAAAVHLSLARAYEELGQKELAQMHREQVK